MIRRAFSSLFGFQKAASLFSKMENCIKLENGHRMPVVGFGMWQCDDETQLESALNIALEKGYRHFDTAHRYQNETNLRNVVEKWLSSGKVTRDELFIVTKLPPQGNHSDRVSHFLQKSLQNLQLDNVDLYLIHHPAGLKIDQGGNSPKRDANGKYIPDLDVTLEQTWKEMEDQVDNGKAKSIGLSNCSVEQLERICKVARIKPANIQVEVNACYPKKKLRNLCAKNGVSVTAFAAFGSPGRKKFYVAKKLVSQGDVDKKVKVPELLTNPVVESIAKKHNKTCGQILLKFLVQQGLVVLAKSVSKQRIQTNIQIFDFELETNDMEELDRLDSGKEGSWQFNWKNSLPGFENHPEFQFKDL